MRSLENDIMSSSSELSKQQLQRIEENKRKALAKRAERLKQVGCNKYASLPQTKQLPVYPQKQALSSAAATSVPTSQFKSQPVAVTSVPHPQFKSQPAAVTSVPHPQFKSQPAAVASVPHPQFKSQPVTVSSAPPSQFKSQPLACTQQNSQFRSTNSQFLQKTSSLVKNTAHQSRGNQSQFVKCSIPAMTATHRQHVQDNVQFSSKSLESSKTLSVESAKTAIKFTGGIKSFYSSSNKPNGNVKKSTSHQSWQSKNHGNTDNRKGSVLNSLDMYLGNKTVTGCCELMTRDRFVVDVAYDKQLIEVFKMMESKEYDASTKKWNFALKDYRNLMDAIKPLSVDIEPLPNAVLRTFHAQLNGRDVTRQIPEHNLNNVDSKLVNTLMPFQKEGVNFVISRNGRALLADDMGLGKTMQSICIACYYRTEWPVLIVVPSSVKLTWAEAFKKWVPSLDPEQINVVNTKKDIATSGLVNIISYDMMSRKAEELKTKRFQVVIMDESHSLKNFKTARTKAAMPLLKTAPRVVLLSGTPALSRPSELYTQITAIDPKLFPLFQDFGVRYCDGHQNNWGWDFSGSSHMTELQVLLQEKIMIRRLKKNVLLQLPSKTRQMIVMDPGVVKTQSSSLKAAANKMSKALSKKEQRGALLQYFSETGAAKIPAIRRYMFDLLDGDHKFLMFAHHQSLLDALCTALTEKKYNFIRIDGSTTSDQRKVLCDQFQDDVDCKVAILSITAASTGITLHSACLVVFAELFWNPGVLVQAEDRVYRIGQKNSVNIQYLVARETADDFIWPLVQEKLDVLSKAGLTKDDFSQADTKRFKDSKQKDIMNYFETSFMEEPGIEELNQIAELEAAYSKGSCENAGSPSTNDCDLDVAEAAANHKGTDDAPNKDGDFKQSSTYTSISEIDNKSRIHKMTLFQSTESTIKRDICIEEQPVSKRARRK